jgi:DNA-binding beta-propeller fold protein YncE
MTANRISLLTAAFLTLATAARAESPPNFITMWSGFYGLRSVAVEPSGTLLTVDTNNLARYTSDGALIQNLAPTGRFHTLTDPADIAVAPTGEIYLLVRDLQGVPHVVKMSSSGVQITQWGGNGTGPGQFAYPAGIATDAAGNVYVADTGNLRVEVFDPGGGFVTQWPTQGCCHNPADLIAVGGIAYVAVGDPGFVEVYTTSGTFLSQWSITLADEAGSSQPTGIAMDAAGALYISDEFNRRVKKFTTSGVLLS